MADEVRNGPGNPEEFVPAEPDNKANPVPEEDDVVLWAKVQYEEGTSGPLKNIEGVMVDDDYGVTVINPEEGVATTIGDRFIVRVDVQQLVMDETEAGDDA